MDRTPTLAEPDVEAEGVPGERDEVELEHEPVPSAEESVDAGPAAQPTRESPAAIAPPDLPPEHPQDLPPGHAAEHPQELLAVHEPEAAGAEPRAAQPLERHIDVIAFSRWQQPGLCAERDGAVDARQLMMQRFRQVAWEEATLYLDPRLSAGADGPLLDALEAAERAVQVQLRLAPSRPDVFAYHDAQLLLAAACTNDDVAAYYDGAVHVVSTDADVATSAVHEYAHHALISAGIVGPAWAQEGIAMRVARETWWRQPHWLNRVAQQPFALEAMESAVPYTLVSEQAVLFYVQAAAMVECALRDERGGLAALVQSLGESDGTALRYSLPPLADPRYFSACARALLE